MRPTSLLARLRLVALAATAAVALAACNAETSDVARKANKPLSPQMVSLIAEKGMAPSSPILVRIFKEESELEVWKVKSDGKYALLKSYPICRWSGELGPKVKTGDRQAPEGFYPIAPGQMNPNSSYYLAFNLGFPNAFDKSYGRSGDFLMVHGDCSSSGCYAMTDEQISEIFSLARESFAGGQRAFQVQAYPFRMTPQNLARHRNNPNMAFWRNLKQGYDHFEVTRQEPKVNVCDRHYVFDAEAPAGATFSPTGVCPDYKVAPEVATAVLNKQRQDEAQIVALSQNTPMAPVRTGRDGGMHPVFLAKLKSGEQQAGDRLAFAPQAPGTIPETTVPPKSDEELAAAGIKPVSAPAGATAPAQTSPRVSATPVPTPAPKPQASAAKPASTTAAQPSSRVVVAQAPGQGQPAPQASGQKQGETTTRYLPSAGDFNFVPAASVPGSSPIMGSGSFSR